MNPFDQKNNLASCHPPQTPEHLDRPDPRVCDEMAEKLAQLAQSLTDQECEMESLTESLSQSYEELTLLFRINEGMRVTRKPEDFFNQICPELAAVLGAQKVIFFWSRDHSLLVDLPQVSMAGTLSLAKNELEAIWDRVESHGHNSTDILMDSNADGPCRYSWPPSIKNIVCIPICRYDKLNGALVALNKTQKPDFDSIDTKLLTSVAGQISVFLENYHLYHDIRDLFMGSLHALTTTIDAKDAYTSGHSERVGLIGRHIAIQMKLSSSQVDQIYLAGLLHDVGKIGISESVLSKPGPLNEQEFKQIQKHPQIGADILQSIKQLDSVIRSVLSHHERYDGRGYPNRLAGRNIPMGGRIIMIADSFDVMIADRVYRKALSLPSALCEIRRFSGTQFDPEITDAFLASDIHSLVNTLENVSTASSMPARYEFSEWVGLPWEHESGYTAVAKTDSD